MRAASKIACASFIAENCEDVEFHARTFMSSRELFVNLRTNKLSPIEKGFRLGRIDKYVINSTYPSSETQGSPLIEAIKFARTPCIKLFIHHPDININAFDDHSEYGMTALMWACSLSDIHSTRLILQHPNVDINLECKYDENTALT